MGYPSLYISISISISYLSINLWWIGGLTKSVYLNLNIYLSIYVSLFLLNRWLQYYMLNTQGGYSNTVFYSYLACFMNTVTLHVYISTWYIGFTRRNTVFVFLWLRHRNTWTPIEYVGIQCCVFTSRSQRCCKTTTLSSVLVPRLSISISIINLSICVCRK